MPLRLVVLIVLGAIVGFCVFGFMATFEPLDPGTQLTWRIVYGTVGTICVAAGIWVSIPRRQG